MPDATMEQQRAFNEFQRISTSVENAARIVSQFDSIDVRSATAKIRVPTLVLHARGDARVPFEEGRRMAALIPGARFVPLESRNHVLFSSEPAWQQYIDEVVSFPGSIVEENAHSEATVFSSLTLREKAVLELVAQGRKNTEIARALSLSEKTVRNYVSVSVDIEERKLAEQALAQASTRKDEFLAMLAHELRNPLAPIRNAVAVMGSVLPVDPKIAWATGIIKRQSEHLARLVDDLMDVARISSGKIAVTREPIELSVLAERARDTAQPLIDARRQRFSVTVPPEPVYVEGDLVRLTQVLGNLLNNASKYTGEGGAIVLEALASETEVEISVTDDGAGIAPDMLPRVFDIFAQEDRTLDRAKGGLGIGLTLVRRLVQLHGGSVEARSAGLGRGSQFLVRLPRLRLPQPLPGEQAHAEPSRSTDARRVLVVDDNLDSAQSTAMLLELAGHEVRVAPEGTGALAAAVQFRPDVVVMDIGLPGMSGYDVARRLRGRGETAGVLLIALTGYGQLEDAFRIKSAGFDHHLVKPASPEQIAALVSGQLSP